MNITLLGATAQPCLLHGAFVPGTTDPVPFEQAVGKTQSLFHTGQPWAKGHLGPVWYYQPFPPSVFEQHRQAGRLLLWDWRPWDSQNQSDPAFSLNAIIRGDHDVYLHSWAQAAAAWGHPFLLKPWSEHNGSWYLYGNNGPLLISAWRHVHDIFAAEGADNASWAWCVNIQSIDPGRPTGHPLEQSYPGDDYVDWVFMDGYNQAGSKTPPWPWFSFTQVFGGSSWYQNTYANACQFNKPIGIAEVSTDDRGGSKPLWIADMFSSITKDFPRIRALCWTEQSFETAHWSLSQDPASLAVFKAAIAAPVYLPAGAWTPEAGRLGAPPFEVAVQSVGEVDRLTAWANDELLKRTAAEDKLVLERSTVATLENTLSDLRGHIRGLIDAAG